MNFEFTEEQRIFRENVAEFCKRWIEPRWIEIDESGRIDPELVRRMASQGLIGLVLDEEYGGQGGGFVEAAIASEEIAYHAPALSLAVLNLLQNSWAYIVQLYGSRDAAAEVLPRVTSGEALVGIASTEAHGGSDVAGIRLRATRTGDDRWIVSGEKSMVSLPSIIKEMPWGGRMGPHRKDRACRGETQQHNHFPRLDEEGWCAFTRYLIQAVDRVRQTGTRHFRSNVQRLRVGGQV
jgi:acyl-CoA dehydrogenase